MSATKKRVITRKTPTVIHECLHEDKFAELTARTKETHNIITGNGTPENGLIVQMVKVNLTQTEILKTLSKLDGSIEILTKKYEESIETATSAKHAVETYKKEMSAFDEGKHSEKDYIKAKNDRLKQLNDLQHSRYTRWITTVSVLIAALALVYNIFFKESKMEQALGTKIDNLGVPAAITRSGKLYPLPDSVRLIMFKVNENISDSIDSTVINN